MNIAKTWVVKVKNDTVTERKRRGWIQWKCEFLISPDKLKTKF